MKTKTPQPDCPCVNLSSATYWLCDPGYVTKPLSASMCSSIKWDDSKNTYLIELLKRLNKLIHTEKVSLLPRKLQISICYYYAQWLGAWP